MRKIDTVKSASGSHRRPRILIVAYHFPPEASIGTHRTLRLVRELVERDWDVTVLTGTLGTYSGGCTIDLDLLPRVPEGVRIVRAPVLRPFDGLSALLKKLPRRRGADRGSSTGSGSDAALPPSGRTSSRMDRRKQYLDGLLRIPDSHVGWLAPATAAGTIAAARNWPDVLYSTAPPWTGQLVARALASLMNCPWVADFRDPWARAPWRERWLAPARRAAQLFEHSVIRRADAVVFTTRTNLTEYAAFYGTGGAAKFVVVRNGCDLDEFADISPSTADTTFTLVHAGTLYGGRKPTALFAALANLRDRGVIDARSFCFKQIGRVGLSDFDMAAERSRLGLEGLVELLPAMPRRDILREMVSASCLLLLQPGTTVSIPGKLFEYFAAGRPVLALAEDGETSDLVRASGGVAVLPEDQSAIEAAIESLVQRGHQPRQVPSLELFDGALRTRELVSVLEHMTRRPLARLRTSAQADPGGMK